MRDDELSERTIIIFSAIALVVWVIAIANNECGLMYAKDCEQYKYYKRANEREATK